jgi:excisionase family DNA binding protein
MQSDFDRPFYTVEQVAEIFQITANTIYRQIRAGKIPYYKVGGNYRLAAGDLSKMKFIPKPRHKGKKDNKED